MVRGKRSKNLVNDLTRACVMKEQIANTSIAVPSQVVESLGMVLIFVINRKIAGVAVNDQATNSGAAVANNKALSY